VKGSGIKRPLHRSSYHTQVVALTKLWSKSKGVMSFLSRVQADKIGDSDSRSNFEVLFIREIKQCDVVYKKSRLLMLLFYYLQLP